LTKALHCEKLDELPATQKKVFQDPAGGNLHRSPGWKAAGYAAVFGKPSGGSWWEFSQVFHGTIPLQPMELLGNENKMESTGAGVGIISGWEP